MTANEKIRDRAIRHALYVQRFKSSEVGDVLGFLDSTVFPDITRKLKNRLDAAALLGFDKGPWTTGYLRDIRASVGSLTSAGFRAAGDSVKASLGEFAVAEAAFQTSILKANVPFDVDFRTPAPELLRSIVTAKPIDGIPFGKWWGNLAGETRDGIVGAVKTGLAQGEKPEHIIRRITGTAKNGYKDGVYQTARYRAEAMVRTISARVQNEATYASFLANADTVKGYQFVATLDTRTTVICMGHDGKVYALKDRRGLPPLHWNCRSTIVAVLKSWEEIGLDGLGLKEPPSAAVRASFDGLAPGEITYPEWLKGQPEAIQNDALGFKRAEIFRAGKLPLDRFYDHANRPLTLSQLAEAEAAFEASAAKRAAAAKKAAEEAAEKQAKAVAREKAAKAKALEEAYQKELAAEAAKKAEAEAKAQAEAAAKKAAEEAAEAELAALEAAKAEAAAKAAAEEAAKVQAEIEAAALAAEQAEHDAAVAAANALYEEQVATLAAAKAQEAAQVVETIHEAQEAAQDVGNAAAAAVKVAKGSTAIEYGKAAKAAVADALKALEDELAAADVSLPGFAEAKKKAMKKAYDSAWNKATKLGAKATHEDLLAASKTAASTATAEIKKLAAEALKDSVGAAEKAAKNAVAVAVEKAKLIDGAKAAGQAAKAEVDAAYAKLLSKKAGKITAEEAHALALEGKKAAKQAYDKAWNVAKKAEKAAAKSAAKAGIAPKVVVPEQAAQVAKATKKAEKAVAKATAPADMRAWATHQEPIPDASAWTKYGEQKGSNPGGFFRDDGGVEWYVKTPATEEHAYNEVLAGRLYSLTGTKSARTKLVRVNGKLSVASKIEKLNAELNKKGVVEYAKLWKKLGDPSDAGPGFATDAWLANWDCVGLSGDNLLFDAEGKLVRIDAGGALRFRAQGGAKGAAFGDTVNEIDTLRGVGPGAGTKASQVFEHLTDQEIIDSIDRVLAVSEKDIAEVVALWGPREEAERKKLLKRLLARRENLRERRAFFEAQKNGVKAESLTRKGLKLGDKWGIRREIDRQALAESGVEYVPPSGPDRVGKIAGDIRTDPKVAAEYQAWRRSLTPRQVTAIKSWSGSGYGAMRTAQTEAAASGAKFVGTSEARKKVLLMEAAFHNAPRHSGELHRGIRWKIDQHGLPNFAENDVVELEALSSFSRSESTARSFASAPSNNLSSDPDQLPVILHVKNAYSGVDISDLSSYRSEGEIVALRRSKYRVLKIKEHPDRVEFGRVTGRGTLEVFLEEITGKD